MEDVRGVEDAERVQERLTSFLQTGCSVPVHARTGRFNGTEPDLLHDVRNRFVRVTFRVDSGGGEGGEGLASERTRRAASVGGVVGRLFVARLKAPVSTARSADQPDRAVMRPGSSLRAVAGLR